MGEQDDEEKESIEAAKSEALKCKEFAHQKSEIAKHSEQYMQGRKNSKNKKELCENFNRVLRVAISQIPSEANELYTNMIDTDAARYRPRSERCWSMFICSSEPTEVQRKLKAQLDVYFPPDSKKVSSIPKLKICNI